MARSATKARPESNRGRGPADSEDWTRTVALVLIAVVLVLGASARMAWLVVPLVFAVVLAVALHPLADRLERLGLPRGGASVLCAALVAGSLLGLALLVTAQAGQVVRNSDRYIDRLSSMAADSAGPLRDNELFQAVADAAGEEDDEPREEGDGEAREEGGGDRRSDGEDPDEGAIPVMPPDPPRSPAEDDLADARDGSRGDGPPSLRGEPELGSTGAAGDDFGSRSYWRERIDQNAGTIGGWAVQGVGGALGLMGQAIVLVFLVLYMLYSREVWSDRIQKAAGALGMRLDRGHLEGMGGSIAKWTWSILGLAVGYAVVIAATGAALGLPHWPLWGVLTGLLVLIPFFGPLVAALMLATVAAIAGQGWGLPLIVPGVFLLLQLVEAYLVHPRLYGRTVHFDSLTVLLGVLLFGFLWGPLGFIAALPVLVLIRGFVEVTPGSEAVAALLGEEE